METNESLLKHENELYEYYLKAIKYKLDNNMGFTVKSLVDECLDVVKVRRFKQENPELFIFISRNKLEQEEGYVILQAPNHVYIKISKEFCPEDLVNIDDAFVLSLWNFYSNKLFNL